MSTKGIAFAGTFLLHLFLFALPLPLQITKPSAPKPIALSFAKEKKQPPKRLQNPLSKRSRKRISPRQKKKKTQHIGKRRVLPVRSSPVQKTITDSTTATPKTKPSAHLNLPLQNEQAKTTSLVEAKGESENPEARVPQKKQEKTIVALSKEQSQVKKHSFDRRSYAAKVRRKILSAVHYPRQAESKGIQGKVVVEISISPYGTLLKSSIVASSNSSLLDNAALKAVQKAAPFSAFSAQQQTALLLRLPIIFRLSH